MCSINENATLCVALLGILIPSNQAMIQEIKNWTDRQNLHIILIMYTVFGFARTQC